jgi:hypothetical protein
MFGSLISMSSPLRKTSGAHAAIMFLIAAAVVAASVACVPSAFAFDIGSLLNNKPKQPDKFAVIRVDALASLIADSNSHVNIYDANGWALRSRAGVIPGAHLLTSDDKYNVATELPAEKSAKLVFYCADLH